MNGNYIETEPMHTIGAVTRGGKGTGITIPPEGCEDKAILLERKSGYMVVDFDGTGMLEIQKVDEADIFQSDEEAVEQAMKDGVKLIPVEELPEDFDRCYLGWIDTPENRKAIADYCKSKTL